MTTIQIELPAEVTEQLAALTEKVDRLTRALSNESPYLSAAEVAKLEGVTVETVRRRVKDGIYEAERKGGKNLRFPREQFNPEG